MWHDLMFIIAWFGVMVLMVGAVYFWYQVIKHYYNMFTGKDLN